MKETNPDSIKDLSKYRKYKLELLTRDFMVELTRDELADFNSASNMYQIDRLAEKVLIDRWDTPDDIQEDDPEQMEENAWKVIEECPRYEVNDQGEVRNRKTLHVLAPRLSRQRGYYSVLIGGKNAYVHKLVADAFLPKTDGKYRIYHKNGNNLDNRLENLERRELGFWMNN